MERLISKKEVIKRIEEMKKPLGLWRPSWFRRFGPPQAAITWSLNKQYNNVLDKVIENISSI